MAVIDTSMDMPRSCDVCPNYQGENSYCLKGCFIPYKMFDMGDVRHKDCPLKSADEMIAEIKEDLLTHAFSVVNPSDTYAYINVVSLEDIEKTINKYFDREST